MGLFDSSTPDNTDSTDGSGFDYTSSAAQLALKQMLAQQMLQQGNLPTQNEVVPGSTSKGSGGGWVVPTSKFAALNALGEKLGGLYMAKSAAGDQSALQSRAADAIGALIDKNNNTPVSANGANIISSTPTQIGTPPAAGATPDPDGLDPISGTANKLNLTPTQTPGQQVSNVLKLGNYGPMGQNAQQMLESRMYPKWQILQDTNDHSVTAVDQNNPNNARVVKAGTPDQKQVADWSTNAKERDFTNPTTLAATNFEGQKMGIVPIGTQWTPKDWSAYFAGGQEAVRKTQVEERELSQRGNAAQSNATVAAAKAPSEIAAANAGAVKATADARSTTQATDLSGAGAAGDAGTNLASAARQVDQNEKVLGLIDKLKSQSAIGGKPINTWNDIQTAIGNKPEWAELKAYLSIDALKSLKESLGNNKMNRNEYQVIAPTQVNAEMPVQAIEQLMKFKNKYDTIDYGVAKARADAVESATHQKTTENIPNPTMKTMPTSDKLMAYANSHFGGDVAKAQQYLTSQGYK